MSLGEEGPVSSMPAPSSEGASDVGVGRAVVPSKGRAEIILVLMAVTGVLYLASSVMVPLVFALMLFFLLRPLVRRLHGVGIPNALGAAVVLTCTLGVIGVSTLELSTPAASWVARLPASVRQLEVKSRVLRKPVEGASRIASTVERITEIGNSGGPPEVSVAKPSLFDSLLEGAVGLISQCLITIVAAYFLLIGGNTLLSRLLQLLPDIHNRKRAALVIDQVEREMSRYLTTVTLINGGLGLCVVVAMYATGMPNPWLWGGLAFAFNYVPYLGAAVGVGIVGLVSLVTFSTLGQGILPPVLYLALTSLEGNFITPMILGRTFRMNPLVVFVWLVLWAWLWSVPGAILAVPLLMLVKIVSERSSAFTLVVRLIEQ